MLIIVQNTNSFQKAEIFRGLKLRLGLVLRSMGLRQLNANPTEVYNGVWLGLGLRLGLMLRLGFRSVVLLQNAHPSEVFRGFWLGMGLRLRLVFRSMGLWLHTAHYFEVFKCLLLRQLMLGMRLVLKSFGLLLQIAHSSEIFRGLKLRLVLKLGLRFVLKLGLRLVLVLRSVGLLLQNAHPSEKAEVFRGLWPMVLSDCVNLLRPRSISLGRRRAQEVEQWQQC